MSNRQTIIRDTNSTTRTKFAVCVDFSNSGKAELQDGYLYSTRKQAKAVLARMPYTGQVVPVKPSF